MPAENALRRLIAIQRRLGRITLADIKANYPIDAMSPGAIGRTMDRLEKAGIDIEFYKSLLRRRSDIGHTIRPADFRIDGQRSRLRQRYRPNPHRRSGKPGLAAADGG